MRLPRWLSSVRTVEIETGWPRPLCRRVAHIAVWRLDWRDMPLPLVLVLIDFPLIAAVAALFMAPIREPRDPGRELLLLGVVVLLVLAVALHAGLTAKTRRFLRHYLASPWCFNCKYPVQPPREPSAASICPECGEPIPPRDRPTRRSRGGRE
ncbi:MAG: hypothetical protein ACF8R7_09735 [Phycisphaerales bacterium JB039]